MALLRLVVCGRLAGVSAGDCVPTEAAAPERLRRATTRVSRRMSGSLAGLALIRGCGLDSIVVAALALGATAIVAASAFWLGAGEVSRAAAAASPR
jgi:hypothetical protein